MVVTYSQPWPVGGYVPEQPPFNGITAQAAGRYLKDRREAATLTQGQLANRVGIPNENYLGNFENGKNDWRRSKYAPALMRELGITSGEARQHLGLDMVLASATPDDHVPGRPEGSRLPDGGVLIRHFGTVQAGNFPFDSDGVVTNGHEKVECPVVSARGFDPDDLFILDVTGDSMTCEEVKRSIPEGSSVLFHSKLEPRKGEVVVVWIPELGPKGVGVLKVFSRDKDEEIVLESYNPRGPRLPAQRYPGMRLQGVAIATWRELRRR
jgi:SOS-response transcriptional repressor LexA